MSESGLDESRRSRVVAAERGDARVGSAARGGGGGDGARRTGDRIARLAALAEKGHGGVHDGNFRAVAEGGEGAREGVVRRVGGGTTVVEVDPNRGDDVFDRARPDDDERRARGWFGDDVRVFR